MAQRYRDTAETAQRLNLSVSTLNKWRLTGEGPRFIKLGRRVVYGDEDVDEFVRQRSRQSTAEFA
ncbi:MAG: helix-turn-helix domain-containing protein [Pseudolabrys sp.]|nr:helix-turn-helix domain-containing protein [Pseudolabrys sp.]